MFYRWPLSSTRLEKKCKNGYETRCSDNGFWRFLEEHPIDDTESQYEYIPSISARIQWLKTVVFRNNCTVYLSDSLNLWLCSVACVILGWIQISNFDTENLSQIVANRTSAWQHELHNYLFRNISKCACIRHLLIAHSERGRPYEDIVLNEFIYRLSKSDSDRNTINTETFVNSEAWDLVKIPERLLLPLLLCKSLDSWQKPLKFCELLR